MQSRYLKLFVVIITILFVSCDRNRVFEQNQKIEKGLWDMDQPVVITAVITDTVNPHNVFINFRNAGTYPFSNIFLFVNTRLPDGQMDRDTAEVLLATPEGKWMGKGLGDIWDNQVLFKQNVRFPKAGEYRFELTHAMRMNPLQGIMDVGMRVERVSN
ncbi:hypothetical protein BH11BAC2_BH11BAC2_02220 [soil metagenome]